MEAGTGGTSITTGGVAGTSSGMGGAAGTSVSGAGGSAGQIEDADEPWPEPEFCSEEETIVPECYITQPATIPLFALRNPRHIAMNTLTQWGGWHLVASENAGHTVRITWGDDNGDVDWRCFDTVPHADRVAATSLTNDFAEWYATTECGEIYVRRLVFVQGVGVWGPWDLFSLPKGRSFALGVAASLAPDGTNYVFIIDRERVFQRYRLGPEFASFSSWNEVATPRSRLLAAGLRSDGRQQLFLVDDAGEPSTCVQVSTELGADFEECVDFGSADVPELIHIASPYRVPEGSPVFALDVDGAVWVRFQDGLGGFDSWQQFVAGPEPFVSITGAQVLGWTGDPLRIAAVSRGGSVYMIVRRFGVWGTWDRLP